MSKQRAEYEAYMLSERWRLKRCERLRMDGYECQTCCSKKNLEVHHRKYENFGNEKMEDLRTLCDLCHKAIHKLGGMKKHNALKKEPKLQPTTQQPKQYRI
jgi:5-methylcytosine-specific restriction endonuclease McrA